MPVIDYFDSLIAYNPDTSELVSGATFQVFAPDDSAYATPLALTDPATGANITTLSSSSVGVLPDFRVAGDPAQVVLKSGSFVTLLTSRLGVFTNAGFDPDAVAAANAAVPLAEAARDAAVAAKTAVESVVATNDGIMTAIAADEDSDFATQQRATIGSVVSDDLANPSSEIGNAARAMVSDGFANRTTSYDGPRFVRANGGTPVFVLGAPMSTDFNSIYWPDIVDAAALFGETDPQKRFYLYGSSNHEPIHAKSGIFRLTGPTMLGPWTYQGRVYRNDLGGMQTETPVVFADPTGQYAAIMLHQQEQWPGAVGGQSTLWAYSNNGTSWTHGGLAIDIPADFPGDGHAGYANLIRIGSKLFALSLAGGFLRPTFALSESYDGRTFTMQRDPLYYHKDIVGDGRRIEWNSICVVPWRGRPWAIGQTMNMQALFTDPRDARIVTFPVSEDLRRPIAKPEVQLYPPQGAETTNLGATRTFVNPDDNGLYLYYQVGNSFYVATVG